MLDMVTLVDQKLRVMGIPIVSISQPLADGRIVPAEKRIIFGAGATDAQKDEARRIYEEWDWRPKPLRTLKEIEGDFLDLPLEKQELILAGAAAEFLQRHPDVGEAMGISVIGAPESFSA
jgi:hypothetical protein